VSDRKASGRIISEEQVHSAVEYLRASAHDIGAAKGRAIKADKMLSHVEALSIKFSEASSAAAKQAEARASDKYLAAIDEMANAAAELEKFKSLREAAVMLIETWRSEQATHRATRF
jgi:rhamnose utilization protein RhaD (predicted bifunctional aldolase and dehydrogenase)